MESPLVEVALEGLHVVGPESFMCAVLTWREENRIVPVWLSALATAELSDRLGEDDGERRRPGAHDVLAEALSRLDGGVERLVLTSYYQGVFIGEIVTVGGEQLDASPSDIFVLSTILRLPILVEKEVLNQASVRVSGPELEEYLGIELAEVAPGPEETAGGGVSSQVDEEFRRMLADMGMETEEADGPDSDAGSK